MLFTRLIHMDREVGRMIAVKRLILRSSAFLLMSASWAASSDDARAQGNSYGWCYICVTDYQMFIHRFYDGPTDFGYRGTPAHIQWWRNYCEVAHRFCDGLLIAADDVDYIRDLAERRVDNIEEGVGLLRIAGANPSRFRLTPDARHLHVLLECGTDPIEIAVAEGFGELLRRALGDRPNGARRVVRKSDARVHAGVPLVDGVIIAIDRTARP